MNSEYEKLQQRFWEHLLEPRLKSRAGVKGHEVEAFLETLDCTFAGNSWTGHVIPIHHEVVQYVAAYALRPGVAHKGENQTGLPYLLNRAYEGFFTTVVDAIKNERIKKMGKEWRFGCLVLPQWLVDHFSAEGEEERRRVRELRKGSRLFPIS